MIIIIIILLIIECRTILEVDPAIHLLTMSSVN